MNKILPVLPVGCPLSGEHDASDVFLLQRYAHDSLTPELHIRTTGDLRILPSILLAEEDLLTDCLNSSL